MMLTQGAMNNLIKRYAAVLKKCALINTFGSLAVAGMLVTGGAGVAHATITPNAMNWGDQTISTTESPTNATVWVDGSKPKGEDNKGDLTVTGAVNPNGYLVIGNGDVSIASGGSVTLNGGIFRVSQGELRIDKGGALNISSGQASVNNFTLASGGTLTLDAGGTLHVDGAATFADAFTQDANSTLSITGAATFADKVTQTSGSFGVDGAATFASGASLASATIGQLMAQGTISAGSLTLGKVNISTEDVTTTHKVESLSITSELNLNSGMQDTFANTGAYGQHVAGTVTLEDTTAGSAVKLSSNGAGFNRVNRVETKSGGSYSISLGTNGNTLKIDTLENTGQLTLTTSIGGDGTGTIQLGTFSAQADATIVGSDNNNSKVVVTIADNAPTAGALTIARGATVTVGSSANGSATLSLNSNALSGAGTLDVEKTGTLEFVGADAGPAITLNNGSGAKIGDTGFSMSGGTLRAEGGLTVKVANTNNALTIATAIDNQSNTTGGNTLAGSTIKANSLTTNASALTIGNETGDTATAVQLLGQGLTAADNLFTAGTTAAAGDITVNNLGQLILGATDAGDPSFSYGGTVGKITNKGNSDAVQFAHGNFTVKDASAIGTVTFSDTTGQSSQNKPNTLTLVQAGTAFNGAGSTLGDGWFNITNGLNVIDTTSNNDIKYMTPLNIDASQSGGYVGDITLGNTDGNAGAISASGAGTYTITDTVTFANPDSKISVSGGTLIIGNLAGEGNQRDEQDFCNLITDSSGTLLIGQNLTLKHDDNGSEATLVQTSESNTLSLFNNGTFGSTKQLTFTASSNATVAIGSPNSTSGYSGSYAAQTVASTVENTGLTIANGATLSVTGDGTDFFDGNVTAVSLNGGGTLALGGASGGSYAGPISIKNGTLAFNGGNITLDNVTVDSGSMSTDNKADYTFNAGTTHVNINDGAGITLDGAHGTTQTLTLNNNADVTVAGGINVTKGTVQLGNRPADDNDNMGTTAHDTTTLHNVITLNGAAATDAKLNVAGTSTVDGITVADDFTGTVTLEGNRTIVTKSLTTLNVNSDLDLSKALLKIEGTGEASTAAPSLATGSTLNVAGSLRTGAVTDDSTATAGVVLSTNGAASYATISASGLWTVNGAIALTANTQAVQLAIATAGVTATDFDITTAGTEAKQKQVALSGTGGVITLNENASIDVTNAKLIVNGGAWSTRSDVTLSVSTSTSNGQSRSAVLQVTDGASFAANTITLENKASSLAVDNGSLSAQTLVTKDASNISVGKTDQKYTDGSLISHASSGTLYVGKYDGQSPAKLQVYNGAAYLGTGSGTAFSTAATAMQANTQAAALLAVNAPVTFNAAGTLIGSSSLLGQLTGSEFGANSLTVISHDAAARDAETYAITTTGDVFIDKGAKLEMYREGGLRSGVTYNILQATGGTIGNVWDSVLTTQRLLGMTLVTSDDHTTVTGTTFTADIARQYANLLDGDLVRHLGTMVEHVGVDVNSELRHAFLQPHCGPQLHAGRQDRRHNG